jgi:S-ribosylhomocysteine lyase LuxS involved in autoinducer biosynthesis
MSHHLQLLRELFPGKVFLDSHEIARVLCISRSHLFRMSSKKTIPFKLSNDCSKIQVSIIEMARYLDTKLLAEGHELKHEPVIISTKKKRGRPRKISW